MGWECRLMGEKRNSYRNSASKELYNFYSTSNIKRVTKSGMF
jgi:hypothetical protein